MSGGKCGTKSEHLKSEGNRFYLQKRFHDALLKYNESLCFAEAESEILGLSYANRSAIYFEMQLYDKCLTNVGYARKNGYPKKNLEILKKREDKCFQAMKHNREEIKATDALSFFKLSYPPKKNLPFVSACLELKIDKKYGKHIVTNRALKVGDVVAIDTPKFKVIKADSRYNTSFDSNAFQRCANCLKDNLLSLIPCTSCCKTMYCSMDCMSSAQKRHHQFECEIIDELLTSGLLHIVVRMFFEGLSLFDDIHDMDKYVNQNDELLTVFDISEDLNGSEMNKKLFMAILSLVAGNRNTFEVSCDYSDTFKKTEKLRNLWNSNENFVKNVLSKLIQVGKLYVHGIGSWSLKLEESKDKEPTNPAKHQELIANACYLFCSLLNHSCGPNIKRVNVGDNVVVIVSRPIAKGEQLFDSYRPMFNNQSKAQRQECLLKDYGFICDCEACVKNWPMNANLKVISEDLLEFAWTSHEDLPFLTVKEAKQKLVELYEIIQQHHQHFPTAELVILQECISNCSIILTKPLIQFP